MKPSYRIQRDMLLEWFGKRPRLCGVVVLAFVILLITLTGG